MPTVSCLCGDVRIDVAQRPDFVHECNCTLCSKTGARWAYFAPSQVTVSGTTLGYSREDKPDANAKVRFCPRCGTTTHFTVTESAVARVGNTLIGVNMALAEPSDLAGTELRYPDGRSWPGEGEFGYVRPASIIGE